MSQPEELPVPDAPAACRRSWRDNKIVLWLVRIGFLLQFYIPAIYCYILLVVNYHARTEFPAGLYYYWTIRTLILVIVQCIVFTLILRYAKLRSAWIVLWCLIMMNVLHSLAWYYYMPWMAVTRLRLILPTVLYFIAVCVEARNTHDADHSHVETPSP